MNNNTNIQILRDGRPDYEYMPTPPTALEQAASIITSSIAKVTGKLVLEARMIAYDTMHSTNYREIKHEVTRRDREQRFIASIGLIDLRK